MTVLSVNAAAPRTPARGNDSPAGHDAFGAVLSALVDAPPARQARGAADSRSGDGRSSRDSTSDDNATTGRATAGRSTQDKAVDKDADSAVDGGDRTASDAATAAVATATAAATVAWLAMANGLATGPTAPDGTGTPVASGVTGVTGMTGAGGTGPAMAAPTVTGTSEPTGIPGGAGSPAGTPTGQADTPAGRTGTPAPAATTILASPATADPAGTSATGAEPTAAPRPAAPTPASTTTDQPAPGAQVTTGTQPLASGPPSARPTVAGETAPNAPAADPTAPGSPAPRFPAAGPDGGRDGRTRESDGDTPAAPGATGPDPLTAASATVAPASTPAVTPTAAPTTAVPATPATHAAQLAERLVPLQKGPDGVHRLTIHLNPVDLGPISVTAEVRGGDIHVHLAGATDAAREALRAALPELRKELQGSGFGSSSLDVSRDASGHGGTPDRQARDHQPGTRTEPGREERTERYRTSTGVSSPRPGHAGLDLHV